MISSEVQRTLVKSPPELWSELSDPAALARHFGELGEVRIVHVEPEKTVEWAAENTTGSVSIQPSGWGTKVTLSVNREFVAPQPPALVQPQAPEQEQEVEPELQEPVDAAEVEPEPQEPVDTTEIEPEPQEPVDATEVEPVSALAQEPEPARQRRRGFFARLFGRGRREQGARLETLESAPTPGPAPDAFAAVRQALAQAGFAPADPPTVAPDPVSEPEIADISAELLAAEEAATAEVTAVLAAVLDRLGAAHHRPFSRS
jgi:hypothetical protein